MTMYDNTFLYLLMCLLTFVLTLLIGSIAIPMLKQNATQPLYYEGPKWHETKAGTPTMGGISFLIAISVSIIICTIYAYATKNSTDALSLILCLVYSVANALIGIVDDLTKIKRKQNAGLTPKAKLILQFAAATLFLFARYFFLKDDCIIAYKFGEIDLGILYYCISLIILVGITNCANLTDGVDGLASSVAFAIGISTFYFAYGRNDAACFVSAAMIGGTVGFLIFNVHPAKIFMGDTGSLYLGSLIAALAFELDNPFIAVFNGGVFVIEGISVILQVIIFKISKKRLFKMAPLHHHLEKSNWDENKICIYAMICTFLFSILTGAIC